MGAQTTNVPYWQLPNSKKGPFWRENGCKTCNCGQNSTKLSEKLIKTKKVKVNKFETKVMHFSSFYCKIGKGGVFKTPPMSNRVNNLRPEDLSATSAISRESDFLESRIDIKREGQISSSVSLSEAKLELNSNLKAEEERGTAISKCKSATESARKCNL